MFYIVFFFQARAIFFHVNSTLYLNTYLIRMLSCFYNSCRNILCGVYSNLLQQKYFVLCTALCVHAAWKYTEFPPIKIYIRRFILLIGSHRKTLGISASRDGRRQGSGIFYRGTKFYFRTFVRPDYRSRPQFAPVCRTPRRFANKVVPGRQMKPYRFSLLRDLHQGRKESDGAGLWYGSERWCNSVLAPLAICNNNPRSRTTPLAPRFPLILSLHAYGFLCRFCICSLFSRHLPRFFARYRAGSFMRSCMS